MSDVSARRVSESGFTLIELLVSTTILALVMGLVALGVQVMSDGWERGGRAAALQDMLGRANDILRRDLGGARRTIVQENGKPRYLFSGSAKAMTYVVREPPYPTAAGLYVVRLGWRKIGTGGELVRSRQIYRDNLAAEILQSSSRQLADTVRLFEGPYRVFFSYQDGGAKGSWLKEWATERSMPAKIKIAFQAVGSAANLPEIVIPLNVSAEPGCAGGGATLCTIQSKGVLPQTTEKKPKTPKATKQPKTTPEEEPQ